MLYDLANMGLLSQAIGGLTKSCISQSCRYKITEKYNSKSSTDKDH